MRSHVPLMTEGTSKWQHHASLVQHVSSSGTEMLIAAGGPLFKGHRLPPAHFTMTLNKLVVRFPMPCDSPVFYQPEEALSSDLSSVLEGRRLTAMSQHSQNSSSGSHASDFNLKSYTLNAECFFLRCIQIPVQGQTPKAPSRSDDPKSFVQLQKCGFASWGNLLFEGWRKAGPPRGWTLGLQEQ